MADIKSDRTLDCKGQFCPVPILKVKKVLEELKPGEILFIEATDAATKADIPAFLKRTGKGEMIEMKESPGLYTYLVKKS